MGQSQGQGVKNNGHYGKVLSQGILMWNIQGLAFTVQKLLARLKFQREWQHDGMTDTTKTMCPPIFDLGGIKNIGNCYRIYSTRFCRYPANEMTIRIINQNEKKVNKALQIDIMSIISD